MKRQQNKHRLFEELSVFSVQNFYLQILNTHVQGENSFHIAILAPSVHMCLSVCPAVLNQHLTLSGLFELSHSLYQLS